MRAAVGASDDLVGASDDLGGVVAGCPAVEGALARCERPQLVVSGFGHLDVSALVRPLPRRVVRGSQMSAILAVPVPIEVMAMARAGGADGC